MRAELEERFNFKCCESIEEFQQESGFALTRERHVKMRAGRHEKDDREQTTDRSRFVLGWDNRAKRRHLAEMISRLDADIRNISGDIDKFDISLESLRTRRAAIGRLKDVISYDDIDYLSYEHELTALQKEKESLAHVCGMGP